MSLRTRLAAEIAAGGPISVAEFMTRALLDPRDGYYATRPALGEAGDFLTAPLISQMFGELVGVWLVETWRALGAPDRVILAEAGPGDGTLMSDILRVAAPAFRAAIEVLLIEVSAPLRERQARTLAAVAPQWATSLAGLPTDAPLLLVANEFLDCLPVRQYERTPSGWAERVVGLDADGALAFGLRPAAPLAVEAPLGRVVERSPAQLAVVADVARRIACQGGAALIVDYGRAEPGCGDTLQALVGHRQVDPLASPGEADLTAHVDFASALEAARAAGAKGALMTQGAFLRRLSIEARAAALQRARPDRAGVVSRQLQRLIAPEQMGELFKALALWSDQPPPGFEDA